MVKNYEVIQDYVILSLSPLKYSVPPSSFYLFILLRILTSIFLSLSLSLFFSLFLSFFLPSLLTFLSSSLSSFFLLFSFSLGLVATLTEGLLWDLSRPLVGNCTLTLLKYDDPESRTVRTCVHGICDNYWLFAVCSCFNILYFSNREKNSDFWATD